MLDMGWAELLVIAIVALLAVGPEKLPEVAQGLARLIRQTRRVVNEFREAIHLEEFDAQIRQSSQGASSFSGVDRDLRTEVVEREAIDLGVSPETDQGGGDVETVALPPQVTPDQEGGEPVDPQSTGNREHPR